MQEQNSKFRYVFNGKEVSKEDFQRLCGDLFIHVEDFTFSAVPFSSMSNFLDGDFKTERQVNEHFKSVLEVGKYKKCSPQCFCDGSCKKPSGLNNLYDPEKKNCSYTMCHERDCTHCFPKGNSTRHKAKKDNEFHKYPLTPEDVYKSEPIFKENPHMQEAYKETEGKLFYELDWEFITQMAERMQSNKKEGKYDLWNWQKPMTPKGIEDLKQASMRHLIAIMNSEYEDDGRPFGHLEALADNMMMINYQLKTNK